MLTGNSCRLYMDGLPCSFKHGLVVRSQSLLTRLNPSFSTRIGSSNLRSMEYPTSGATFTLIVKHRLCCILSPEHTALILDSFVTSERLVELPKATRKSLLILRSGSASVRWKLQKSALKFRIS